MTWNVDRLSYEQQGVNPGEWFSRSKRWAERLAEANTHEAEDDSIIVTILDEWLQYRYQRPRWYVSAEMLELLDTLTIDTDDLTGVFIPYDAFTMVFEKGTLIEGVPTKFIRMHIVRSKISQKMLGEFIDGWDHADISDCMYVRCATSLTAEDVLGKSGAMNPTDEMALSGVRHLSSDNTELADMPDRYAKWVKHCIRLMVAAWLYNAARPEFVRPFTLPRSERFQVRDRGRSFSLSLPRRILRPDVKWIGDRNANDGDGEPKAHHFRGWALRVLRHERYRRKPDGTFRAVMVPPCEIHPELAEPIDINLSRPA